MKRLAIAALAVLAVAAPAVTVTAWGNTGHRLIGVAAMRALPSDLPAFLLTPGAIADVGELAREPDRW
ncbi:S1/P1 Nuclease, partial [Escherichia coli]|nr:S1/P1 Nuclease [Escherichia coli]